MNFNNVVIQRIKDAQEYEYLCYYNYYSLYSKSDFLFQYSVTLHVSTATEGYKPRKYKKQEMVQDNDSQKARSFLPHLLRYCEDANIEKTEYIFPVA